METSGRSEPEPCPICFEPLQREAYLDRCFLEWWIQFGDGTPELQAFAVRVLGLTCSSSGCERNWSTYNQVHTKRRNRLSSLRMNSLVYIMYNRKLKENKERKKDLKEGSDPLVYDDVASDDDWFVDDAAEEITAAQLQLEDLDVDCYSTDRPTTTSTNPKSKDAFCYRCIVKWSGFVKEKYGQSTPSIKCPLCKVENWSIIYSFDGESFSRFYLNGACQDSFFTSGHEFRLRCYSIDPGNIFNVQQYWKHHRYNRKNIWLPSWLRREIQTLTKEEDVDIIVHHVHGVIEAFFRSIEGNNVNLTPEKMRENFRAALVDAARPFLGGKTERFVSELELFMASGLNFEAYDRVYMHHLDNYAPMEASSQDQLAD